MFKEKIDTSVTAAMIRKTSSVPTTARIATINGRPAATALPNTRIRRTSTIGNVIASALRRSFSTRSPTCLKTAA